MTSGDKTAFIAETLASPWWKPGCGDAFAENFSMEFPFAPPGMQQVQGYGHFLAVKEWLCRTLKRVETESLSFHEPSGGEGNILIAVFDVYAAVHWGGTDGSYIDHHLAEFTLDGKKLLSLRDWSNPLRYIDSCNLPRPDIDTAPIDSLLPHFDGEGRFVEPEDSLNPMGMINSRNLSVPAFPWLY